MSRRALSITIGLLGLAGALAMMVGVGAVGARGVEVLVRTPLPLEGDTIVLDLATRDGPSPDDHELLRKAEMFEEELGHRLQLTVGRTMIPVAGAPGGSTQPRALAGPLGRVLPRALH